MRIKKSFISIPLALALGVMILGLAVWLIGGSLLPGIREGQDRIVQADGSTVQEEGILKEILMLEVIERDQSKGTIEDLKVLAQRKDAVGYRANLLLAERAMALKEDSVIYYRQALDLYETKEVRYKLARELLIQGKREEAAEQYKLLLPDEEAYLALLQMEIEPAAIGEMLLERKQWKSAADFLKPYLEKAGDHPGKLMLQKQYARALGELGLYKETLQALEPLMFSNLWDQELQWWYGRGLEGTNQGKEAKKIYQSLGARGAYRLGLLLEKEGASETAAAVFSSSNENLSRWRGARLWEELGMREKALEIYLELSKEQDIHQDDAAYRAYILMERMGKKDRDALLSFLKKHPAWAARLNKKAEWETIPVVSYERPEFIDRVEVYRESGRGKLADIELSIGERLADNSAKLALGDWYLEQETYYQAVLWGIRALREQPSKRAYELAYQRPYEEAVRAAAKEFNLDPNIIWAVMREESHYRAEVYSPVGAVGLMQVMPATGKDIAGRLKVPFEDGDLLKPEVNIRFGAYYLRSMLKMFGDDEDKALAAYNGGPGNVRRWSESKLGKTKTDFPTAITFQETREYITKVKNTHHIYRWLYEK